MKKGNVKVVIYILFAIIMNITCGKIKEKICHNPLCVDPATQDFSKNPQLLERIRSSPHGYFRFINIPFSQTICQRFSKLTLGSRMLNLHGDAHLEQYAVTDLGRGLTDFDDSSSGPGIIDIMRFGVSLDLACRQLSWREQSDSLFDKFLQGYDDALRKPSIIVDEPTVVNRIKSGFTIDRKKYFKWVDSLMEPIPPGEQDSLLLAFQTYVQDMVDENSELNKEYFTVIKSGRLRMGIGSALDLKYLIRIEGKTRDKWDDVVLEVKQVRNLQGIDCIQSIQRNDPFRILIGQARIAYQPFYHLGYFQFRGMNFWVHSWVDNYKELEINSSLQSVKELYEVAYDVGVQLGLGHVKHIAAPLDLQLRKEQLRLIESHANDMKKVRNELSDLTVKAWEEFCRELEGDKK